MALRKKNNIKYPDSELSDTAKNSDHLNYAEHTESVDHLDYAEHTESVDHLNHAEHTESVDHLNYSKHSESVDYLKNVEDEEPDNVELMSDYIRERITQLRLNEGISEYKLSYNLGHSRGYINNISSGKTLPSMTEFLSLCEYFEISPGSFFDSNSTNPVLVTKIIEELAAMGEEDLELVLSLIKRIKASVQ